jgi:geranylgeranyl diphosphate synthase type I
MVRSKGMAVNAAIGDVERTMQELLARYGARFPALPGALPVYEVLAYHLGWRDERMQPASGVSGKRFRPALCTAIASAVCGDAARAVGIAAAIELLHNFTLIHDDIQDRSRLRRHRPTIWALWGDAQAINAGDALFVLSEIAALEAAQALEPSRGAELVRRFNETALLIVEGQVLDLSFEQRPEVSVNEYLTMIERKTAALIAYSAWAGALVAGAPAEVAARLERFGRALGLGFQIRDDYLGVWGDPAVTGKPRGDDLRQRKKSLPIVLVLERAAASDRAWLLDLWRRRTELSAEEVAAVIELLERYAVRTALQEAVERFHGEALAELEALPLTPEGVASLRGLVAGLPVREA